MPKLTLISHHLCHSHCQRRCRRLRAVFHPHIMFGPQAFGGFVPVSSVPFDHESPPATIKARAKVVHDKSPKGYAQGKVPDGPIPASDTNGTAFDVELVPIANTNAMRITVLPVLA